MNVQENGLWMDKQTRAYFIYGCFKNAQREDEPTDGLLSPTPLSLPTYQP